jgi:hypothetical protein
MEEFEGFLYRDVLFEHSESALRYFSEKVSEENGKYEFIDSLALEQEELIRQAENLREYARIRPIETIESLKALACTSRKIARRLGDEIRHYTTTINLHDG